MKNITVTMQGSKAIPAGYKQTELGVIPDDWEVMLVGEAFAICNNLRMPISSTIRDGMNGDYPYYGPTKIQGYINEYRVMGEYALIGEDGDHFLKYESVPQTQLAIGKFNVNNHAHLIKEKIGSAQWFYWFYRNRDISIYLTRQGAGRFKLNKASLQRIPCIIPPIAEQAAIASVLSDSEKLIDAVEQLIAKKQAIKTATMQQLLSGSTRMPQFAQYPNGTPKNYKSSELGVIPEDWEVVRLAQVARVIDPHPSHRAPPEESYGVPFVGIGDLNESGELINSEVRRVNQSILQEHSERYNLNNQPIGLGRVASIGKVIRLRIGKEPYAISPTLGVIDGFACKNDFLFYYLKSESVTEQFSRVMSGSTRSSVGMNVLKEILVVKISSQEQISIATILSDMDAEIGRLKQKLSKIRDIKQGMMQQLLTGRIRLPLEQQP